MKCVILCAGFGTRLYPLTENKAKPLLDIKGKPMLTHIFDKLGIVEDIEEVYVVCNGRFYMQFTWWLQNLKNSLKEKTRIINDNVMSNEERLGGLGDLNLAIDSENIDDDLLLILGDNLFDLSLKDFVNYFKEKENPCIGVYDIKDFEKVKKYGNLELDETGKVTSFIEKPENPKTTLAGTGIYAFTKQNVEELKQYLADGNKKEGPGFFLATFFLLAGFLFATFFKENGMILVLMNNTRH
ncbi:sugar phosphate nucleotidyltransferase [Nanoarchaeota archaeon]